MTTNNYIKHLDREWDAKKWPKDGDDDPQVWIYRHLVKLLNAFAGEGHSGTSAPYTIALFCKLANFEPIGPLTGEDSEWMEVEDGTEQNKRCSHVFRKEGQAYDIEGRIFREPNGACFTSGDSHVPVEFPYTPTKEFVDVGEEKV